MLGWLARVAVMPKVAAAHAFAVFVDVLMPKNPFVR